jgi:hypothetical protein
MVRNGNTAKTKEGRRKYRKNKRRQNTLNKIQIKTLSFHIVRNGNTAKTKEGRRKHCKNKRRQNTLNKIQIKTSSFHIVRNGNTAKTKEGRRKYCKNKRRQNTLNKIQIKKSKIVLCICAAVRHIHVKRRASLREAWSSLLLFLEEVTAADDTEQVL